MSLGALCDVDVRCVVFILWDTAREWAVTQIERLAGNQAEVQIVQPHLG